MPRPKKIQDLPSAQQISKTCAAYIIAIKSGKIDEITAARTQITVGFASVKLVHTPLNRPWHDELTTVVNAVAEQRKTNDSAELALEYEHMRSLLAKIEEILNTLLWEEVNDLGLDQSETDLFK